MKILSRQFRDTACVMRIKRVLIQLHFFQVKPGKIVSGQEADKTNLLLQALATVIENKVN